MHGSDRTSRSVDGGAFSRTIRHQKDSSIVAEAGAAPCLSDFRTQTPSPRNPLAEVAIGEPFIDP